MSFALDALGSFVQGRAARVQSKMRARVLEQDALARKAAGESEALGIEREGRAAVAAGTVAAATSGFTVDGSALDVLGWMEQQTGANAGKARWEAEREARAIRNEAAATRYQGKVAYATGLIRAGSSLASGANAVDAGGSSLVKGG